MEQPITLPLPVAQIVTDDPHHRDPSFLLWRVPRRDVIAWILFLTAGATALLLHQWLFPILYR